MILLCDTCVRKGGTAGERNSSMICRGGGGGGGGGGATKGSPIFPPRHGGPDKCQQGSACIPVVQVRPDIHLPKRIQTLPFQGCILKHPKSLHFGTAEKTFAFLGTSLLHSSGALKNTFEPWSLLKPNWIPCQKVRLHYACGECMSASHN